MSAVEITADEMFESLTGFDEIAISQHFGAEITELAERKQLSFLRALVFVHKTRSADVKPKDAKASALGLTIKDLNDYFEESEDEPMPDEPVSAEGNVVGQPG